MALAPAEEILMTAMGKLNIRITRLGQSGFRFHLGGTTVYVDPYLSHYVEEVDGQEFRRLVSIPISADKINDADWVLISHIHMDHCDPKTLLPLSEASPSAKFVGPNEVCAYLVGVGIPKDRLVIAPESWCEITSDVAIKAIPAAHPEVERDQENYLKYVGYVVEYNQHRIYHSGDTSPDPELIEAVKQAGTIDVAILPVNERNYYRDKRGIIGNMSLREAFQMAVDIGAKTVIPMHWDMFAPNSVYREEIKLLYKLINPPFGMVIEPRDVQEWM